MANWIQNTSWPSDNYPDGKVVWHATWKIPPSLPTSHQMVKSAGMLGKAEECAFLDILNFHLR
jgi:hypothetical protein